MHRVIDATRLDLLYLLNLTGICVSRLTLLKGMT